MDKLVSQLVKQLQQSQWIERDHKSLIPDCDITTKAQLRNKRIKGISTASTSGSTGEPLIVDKTEQNLIWHRATNILELLWRGWDPNLNLAVITAKCQLRVSKRNTNPIIFPNTKGKVFTHPTSGDFQSWLDSIDCQYLSSYPSIITTLETSNFIDVKSTGEHGGTMYSSTEVGTIGIQCPDNPDVYHIMENIILEIDDNSNIIVTDLTHPSIKRYMIGDVGQFCECYCGRKLQTIKKDVTGRVRNMAVGIDGRRYWPLFGSIVFAGEVPNLERYQVIQTSLTNITLKVKGSCLTELDLVKLRNIVRDNMGKHFSVDITIVQDFAEGKFEEFICMVK